MIISIAVLWWSLLWCQVMVASEKGIFRYSRSSDQFLGSQIVPPKNNRTDSNKNSKIKGTWEELSYHLKREDLDPLYLCRKNTTDCVSLLQRDSVSSTGEDIQGRVEVDDNGFVAGISTTTPEFSEDTRDIRLHNGTIIGKKPMKGNNNKPSFPFHRDSSILQLNPGSSDTSNQLQKKLLVVTDDNPSDASEDKKEESGRESHEDGDENLSNHSRIIAYSIRPTMPGSNSSTRRPLSAYPTITLAQLARQLLFPDWLWTRLSSNRKTDLAGLPISASSAATVPLASVTRPQIPSLTFDNNFSRFLKLFTLVRFQNTGCASPAGQNGTCYTARECQTLGGTATSQCANGFGVCCVFQVRCGGITSRNGTYFVDTGVVFAANQVQTCNVQILKTTPTVRQIRLDFQLFSLRQPVAGSCEVDRFVISGQNTNNVIPILCGQNSGSHVYIETSESSGGIQLSVMTTGDGSRRWSIQITQFDVSNPAAAPPYCLQYYTNIMGSLQSFNYITDTAPQYLNNLNYAICIRRERGFCSVTYTNASPDGNYQPFQIVNANAEGSLVIPSGQAGVGYRDCPYDYIILNGLRLCGERLNDATSNVLFVNDAPVTDVNNGPFDVLVRTNEIDVGGGFNLYYRQNPCMSSPG